MVATEAQIALGPKLLEILMLIIVVWTGVLGYSWRQGRDAMRDDPNINEGENYDSDTELSDIEQIKTVGLSIQGRCFPYIVDNYLYILDPYLRSSLVSTVIESSRKNLRPTADCVSRHHYTFRSYLSHFIYTRFG